MRILGYENNPLPHTFSILNLTDIKAIENANFYRTFDKHEVL